MTAALEHLIAALSDRYRIERELGAGGMATVYLAPRAASELRADAQAREYLGP